MQASQTRLRQLVEGTKQYVVPLFQRRYSWGTKHWKTLWADLHGLMADPNGRAHFFGSIVTTPAVSVPQGVGKWLLIDGQQRLTTVMTLLAALRDAASRAGEELLGKKIDGQYLVNAYESGDERLKVLPTQDDRLAFAALIARTPAPTGRLKECYDFFAAKIARLPADRLDVLHKTIVDRLALVSILCDDHDNP